MSRICQPHGIKPHEPQPRTPGTLGRNDSADPNTPSWLTGDTPGPLGINDHADPKIMQVQEPARIFLAAAGPVAAGVLAQKRRPSDPIPLKAQDAIQLVFPKAKLVIGGIWGAVESGSVWRALDGPRLVFSADSNYVIYYQAEHFYLQTSQGFIGEVVTCPLIEAAQRAKPVVRLTEIGIKFAMGVLAGSSPLGFAAVVGTEVLEFVFEHYNEFDGWVHQFRVFLQAREIFKRFAPVLYDKLFNAALRRISKDAVSHLEEATTPDAIAFMLGVILGDIGKEALEGKIGVLRIALIVLGAIAKRFFLSVVPGALELTQHQYQNLAQEIIAKMRESGLAITMDDVHRIIDEVRQHPKEVKSALDLLKEAFKEN